MITRSFLFLFLISFLSCNDNIVTSSLHTFDKEIWLYKDSVNFQFEIFDTTKIYQLDLNVVHNQDYSHQNLYTLIHSKLPSGRIMREVLSLEFADSKGFWMGEKKGENYLAPILLQPKIYFRELGKYKMTIFQHSRQDSVAGINNIEFILRDLGKKSSSNQYKNKETNL